MKVPKALWKLMTIFVLGFVAQKTFYLNLKNSPHNLEDQLFWANNSEPDLSGHEIPLKLNKNAVYISKIYGESSPYRIKNRYIIYVGNAISEENKAFLRRIEEIEEIALNTTTLYFAKLNSELIEEVRRFPGVLFLEQDQFHPINGTWSKRSGVNGEVQEFSNSAALNLQTGLFDKFSWGLFSKKKSQSKPQELEHQDDGIIEIETDSWALDRISHYGSVCKSDFKHIYKSNDGENVIVYVGDSHIAASEDIEDSLIRTIDATRRFSSLNLKSQTNHSSRVASLISGKTYGIAKKSKIISVVIAEPRGLIYSNILRAFAYILSDYKEHLNRDPRHTTWVRPRAILNLSIILPYPFRGFKLLYQKLLDADIGIVIAAGNQGTDICNLPIYNDERTIVVGATAIGDEVADFSNFGKCVEIYAPGNKVKVVDADNSILFETGTSFSAPIVTGIMAALLSQDENRDSSVSKVKNLLLEYADEMTFPESQKSIKISNRGMYCTECTNEKKWRLANARACKTLKREAQ